MIAKLARDPEQQNEARDRLIRCLDGGELGDFQPILDALCMTVGLYPYVEDVASVTEDTAMTLEMNRQEIGGARTVVLHPEQSVLFQRLVNGENLTLSAPTSFGKSTLIDALLATGMWNNVLIVVPTIALMDEARRRLSKFSNQYKIITHGSQKASSRNIYILTQERVLSFIDLPPLDLFVIDEFYKLAPESDMHDERMVQLNIAWSRLRRTGAQYFLAGPFVDGLSLPINHDMHSGFVQTSFKTVAVDVEDRSDIADIETDLETFLESNGNEGTLVFVRSPAQASKLSRRLTGTASNFAKDVSTWISQNFDANWYPAKALDRGIGIHVGPLPRSLQRAMIRLFDSGDISALICTSTLLEGVNTSAKNVVIFDKKISGPRLNSFTFLNASGRAGRMMKHHVGRVVTYAGIPEADGPLFVDVPIESQSSGASAATLIHVDEQMLTGDSKRKIDRALDGEQLPLTLLRRHPGIQPEILVSAAKAYSSLSARARSYLEWHGYPTSQQLSTTVEFAFENLTESGDRRGMNAGMLLGRLGTVRASNGVLKSIVDVQERYAFPGQTRDDVIDNVLSFERNWLQHKLPKFLRALQSIQNYEAIKTSKPKSNYELFIREVEAAFQSETVVDLEELGLPAPLTRKLQQMGLSGSTRDERLEKLKALAISDSIRGQFGLVDLWFIDDVVAGV